MTPSGLILDDEKDLSGMGDVDYLEPIFMGYDYFELAVVMVWQNPASYRPMEQYLMIEGMKLLGVPPHRMDDLTTLQMILMYKHYEEIT